jgi:hypothetical protein
MHDAANRGLEKLLARLKHAPVSYLAGDETREENVGRMRQPGRLTQIDEETYRHHLEVLPPQYQGSDFFAAFDPYVPSPLRLFFRGPVQCFCRQLTEEETRAFCEAAGIGLPL